MINSQQHTLQITFVIITWVQKDLLCQSGRTKCYRQKGAKLQAIQTKKIIMLHLLNNKILQIEYQSLIML